MQKSGPGFGFPLHGLMLHSLAKSLAEREQVGFSLPSGMTGAQTSKALPGKAARLGTQSQGPRHAEKEGATQRQNTGVLEQFWRQVEGSPGPHKVHFSGCSGPLVVPPTNGWC